jgi:murein DD-endopeptidase MepM/ murein hydrolase activator NlpD
MFRLIVVIFILLWLSWFCPSSLAATLIYYRYHIVQRGDTLSDIGKQYGVPYQEIKKKNNLRSDRIYPGQKLIVPIKIKGVYHQIKRYETLWRISRAYKVSMEEVIRLNRLSNPEHIKVGQRLFIPGASKVIDIDIPEEIIIGRKLNTRVEQKRGVSEKSEKKESLIWPVEGKITEYRYSDPGPGIDILAPEGTVIVAPAQGKVYFSGWLRGYGRTIIIEHEELGLYTCYMHNSVNLVEEGDVVKKGDPVAKIGNTGTTEEIMLHFEIRRAEDGKPVDPLDYLP